MAITRVGGTQAAQSGTGATLVTSYTSTAGNTLVATIQHQGQAINGVTDSAGNTWARAADTDDQGATTQRRVAIWYCLNAAAVTSVTVTMAGTSGFPHVLLSELSGVGALRGAASAWNSAGSANPAIAAVTSALTGDYVHGAIAYAESTVGTRKDTLVTTDGYTEVASFNGGSNPRASSAASVRTVDGSTGPQWTLSPAATSGSVTAAFTTGTVNQPPTVDAGADQTIDPNLARTFVLQATASDPDGSAPTVAWHDVTGGGAVVVPGSGATRTRPVISDANGVTKTYRATATDSLGAVSQDTCTVTFLPHVLWLKTSSSLVPLRRG